MEKSKFLKPKEEEEEEAKDTLLNKEKSFLSFDCKMNEGESPEEFLLRVNSFIFNQEEEKREEKFMMYLFNSLLELKVIVSDCQKDERYFVETFCFINEQLLELKANYLNLLHESEKQIKNFSID